MAVKSLQIRARDPGSVLESIPVRIVVQVGCDTTCSAGGRAIEDGLRSDLDGFVVFPDRCIGGRLRAESAPDAVTLGSRLRR